MAASQIGWIGLGAMGSGMSHNLQAYLTQADQPPLLFYNRTPARGTSLTALGGRQAPSIQALVEECDVIFLSLSDDIALGAVITSITETGTSLQGKLIVDTSTVHPDSTQLAFDKISKSGASFVAAPVFGASPVAAEGKLLFVVAGGEEQVTRIEPYIVGVMGRAVIKMGSDVRRATALKTIGNFLTAGMMEIVSEAHTLASKTSIPSESVQSLLEHQYGPLASSISHRLLSGAYLPPKGSKPWSSLDLAIKDVGHGVKMARDNGMRLDVGETALGNLLEAKMISEKEMEGRELDSSSLFGVVRRNAGLDFETPGVKERDGTGSQLL